MKTKTTVRKNFMMWDRLVPELRKTVEETGFTEAQIFNIAISEYFENRAMKKVLSNIDPQSMVQQMIEYAEKMKSENPSISDSADEVISACENVQKDREAV